MCCFPGWSASPPSFLGSAAERIRHCAAPYKLLDRRGRPKLKRAAADSRAGWPRADQPHHSPTMTSEEPDAPEGRRAKRRCARNRFTAGAMPSAIHYVGYVSAGDRAAGGLPSQHCLPPPPPPAARCRQPAAFPYPSRRTPSNQPSTCQVEDDETPEMIMAKFAELERIQAAAAAAKAAQGPAGAAQQQQGEAGGEMGEQGPQLGGAGGDPQQPAATAQQQGAGGSEEGGLTEEQLLEVFKQVREGECCLLGRLP